jgi:hypothetical protein
LPPEPVEANFRVGGSGKEDKLRFQVEIMWARVIEIMLGFWLLASPFIFRFDETKNLANDLSCGLAVIVFGFLSHWRRAEWAHFLTLAVALWLVVFGFRAGYPAPPSAQNQIILGLLVGMLAVIPNRTNEIPAAWRDFYDRKSKTGDEGEPDGSKKDL